MTDAAGLDSLVIDDMEHTLLGIQNSQMSTE